MNKFQEFKCNYLFTEEENRLHPLIFKYEIPSVRGKSLYSNRIEYTAKLAIEHLKPEQPNNKKFAIVGSGPSLDSFIDQLDGTICTINRAHEYLITKGIVPNTHVFFENDVSEPEQSLGGPSHPDVTYYVCSSCREELFDSLKNNKVVLWHGDFTSDEYHHFMDSLFPDEIAIDAPHSSLTKAIGVAKALGYRKFDLYGIDCAFPIEGGKDHVTGDTDSLEKITICARNKNNEYRRYISNSFYIYQVIQFMNHYQALDAKIHGDGLLGFVYGG